MLKLTNQGHHMKKLNQTGFSPFETVLLLLVVVVLGFAGYVVYHNNKPTKTDTATTDPQKVQNKTYTDTAKKFTFEYPGTWETAYLDGTGGDFRDATPEPDWTVTSRYVEVKPLKSAKDNNIRVSPGCDKSVIQTQKDNKDKFHTQTDLKINGYEAFYDKTDFKGDAESYLDHAYYVLDGANCVIFQFRENWHHDTSNTNFDDKQNLPGFEAIVHSIKFTK